MGEKIVMIIGVFVTTAILIGLLGLLAAIPVYFLWNWIAPAIDLAPITYWQAWGIYFLSDLLFRANPISSKNLED